MSASPRWALARLLGREAIQRSACSSTGERNSNPFGPFAKAQRRACSPNSVCCLIQPMSVLSAFGELVRALLEARGVVEEDEIELRERLRHRLVVDATADDRREAAC